MGHPPQGIIPDDVLRRNKISDETWTMLADEATNTKRLRKVLRRILRSMSDQNEE